MSSRPDIDALVQKFGIAPARTPSILVVDDELFNVKVLRSFLEDRYTVYEACSGDEALRLAQDVELDVVLTDQRMAGMTGVELLERLRVVRPEVAGIVLTGYSDTAALVSAINRAAVFRFLKKPWRPDEVFEAVEQACEHVNQRRTIGQLVTLLAARSEELSGSLKDLKEKQQQMLHLERLGTMGQLAAGITHDVRNVMVSLRAVEMELLESKSREPELVETVQVGMSGLDSLLRTLDALHSFTRGGGVELQLRAVQPATVVRDAIAIARMDGSYRMRKVDVDLGAALPVLHADQPKLTQVMVNLVRNALQATRERAAIRIEARAQENGVVLAVEDDGPGVAPALREKIFDPFVSSKGDGGLGMGLYMARLIVDAHKGHISVGDALRGGARFQVELPAARV